MAAALIILLALQSAAGNPDFQRGFALVEKGQFEAAIPFLLRATEARPRDPRMWKALGVAHAALKHYEFAEPAFRRACELDPKLEDACYYHGRALYALNRFEPSLLALKQALAVDPASWKISLGMAQALEGLGESQAAEIHFTGALSRARNADPKPGIAYGFFLIRQGRFDDAAAPLEQVLARYPQAVEAHILLGRALMEGGKTADAIGHFEKAVVIDSSSAQAHLLLAKAYARAGRTAEAHQHYEAAARYEEGSRTVK